MGKLKKVGKVTAPRSFGTGGAKLTSKTSVSNTLNKTKSTYQPAKKNAFDTLFEIANEAAQKKLSSVPRFTLPTTSSGIVQKASSVLSSDQKENVGSELAFARRARSGGDTINALQEQQNAYLEQYRTTRPRNALDDFGWGLGYGAERTAQGLLSAGEGITDFIGSGFWNLVGGVASLGGNFENPVSTYANEAAQAFLNNSISQDYAQSIEERYKPSDFNRTIGDIEGTVANMLPSIVAAIATGGGSAVAQGGSALAQGGSLASKVLTGQNLGKAIMGVQAAGSSAQEAYQEGADVNQALAYGTASGLLETVIESISGGVPGLGKGAVSQVVGKVVSNPAVQKALDIAGEGGEEALSTIITPFIKQAIYDPDAATATPEEIAQSALMGMAAAGVLQAGIELPSAISNRVDTTQQANANLNNPEFVQRTTQDAISSINSRINNRFASLQQLADELAAQRIQQAEAAASKPAITVPQQAQQPETPASQMQSVMGTLGESGKAAFSNAAQQAGSVEEAYPEFSRAYSDGYTGKAEVPDQTPEAQAAYYAGQNDAQAERAAKPGFSESAYSAGTTQAEQSFYDALGKATGTSIEITAPTGADGFNGYYANGKIQIAADAENPGMVVAAHETTHRLQETAPEAYQKFKDYAIRAVSGQDGADALVSAYQRRYAEAGITLDAEAAMDEIAADYAQDLMIDEAMIRRVVADDRTLAQKFVDSIKELLSKIKRVFSGSNQQVVQLETARDLWLEALKEGSRTSTAINPQKKQDKTESKNTRFSLKSNRIAADIEIDPEYIEPVNDITNQELYDYLVNEFSSSGYNGRPIVAVRNQNNGYTALTGSHRIIAAREAGVDVPVVVVENQEASELLLDEFGDEGKSRVAKELYEDGLLREAEKDLLIREDELNSENYDIPYEDQTRFSLKGTSALQRQVQNLQERNQYLKEQMKVSKGVKTDRKKTASYAKDLLSTYESRYSAETLTSDLLSIYDEIANSRDGVDMDGLRARAQDVAGRILDQSVREDAELYNEYASLRERLRNTKIQVPKSVQADLEHVGGYAGFRKGNMGRMKLSSSDGLPIDTVYSELAQEYPGLFDEQTYTNPADQLINISDVLESIQPVLENPYSSEMEMATKFVANEILEGYFDVPQQKPTFADRQQAKLEAAKAAGNRRLYEQREQSRERIAQLRHQGREQVKQAIAKERLRRENQVQAIKEKYTSKEAAARERRTARDLRNKIQRHVKSISTKLLSPTDSKNVPDSLRKPVAALLDAVNLESAYTVDPQTGKRTKGGGGDPAKRTAAFIELRNAYQNILKDETANMVIDPALLGSQSEGFQGDFDKVISMHDKKLVDMTSSELETIWKTVKAVEYSIITAGKNLAKSKFAGTVDWARALQEENQGKKARLTTQRHWTIDLLTPLTYFSRMGESGNAVYKLLRNAQDSQQQMITDISKEVAGIVSTKDARAMRNTTHQFTTQGGQDLTLSTAQIMSLYELSKRKQAQDHLYTGGIYQPAVPGTSIKRGTEAIRLTPDDVSSIVSTLTPDQAKVADRLQSIMATTLADLGNEASMKAYGYKKFTGADYWPISVAREGVNTTVENSGGNTRSISNIGLAKSVVPKASNPLNIGDAFTTFAQHVGDMTDYAAYLLPMEDLNRLYNFRYKDGEGNYTGQTVKGLLDRTAGPQSAVYWQRLMEDIQNGTAARSDSQLAEAAQKLISRTKGASVGANLRVVIQQPTAYLRAAAVLDPASLTRGLAGGVTKGSGWEKALKWAPIAQKKQAGGFEIGSGVQLEQELFGDLSKGVKRASNALSEASMALPGKADEVTWGKLWNACEWQTAAKRKDLTKGSDAFYKATAELFTDMIDQSQVVDGVMQRSQVMRSNSALNKMATSFMGEPTMSLNMVIRSYDKVRQASTPKARSAARRQLARAAFSLVASGVANAAAQSLVDALRDDDKDKKYWDRFFSAFTGMTGEEETPWEKAAAALLRSNISGNLNPAGQIPYANDVLSMIQGYDVARMDAEAIGDFITAGQNVVKNIGGEGTRTPLFAVKELANAAAKMFGVSIGNVLRDASGIINSVAIETGNTALMYELEKATLNIRNSSNKSGFLDIAYMARESGDTETYNRIASDLISSGVVEDQEAFEKAMASRLKDSEGFSAAQKKLQDSLFSDIQKTGTYRGLDQSAKDKAADKAQDYAYAVTMKEFDPDYELPDSYNWVEKVQEGASVGLTPDEYILFDLAYSMLESDKDKEGNSIPGSKQEKVIQALENMDLTDKERSYLFGTKYSSDKNNPWS